MNLINVSAGIVGQYNGEPDIQAAVGGAYISQVDTPGSTAGQLAQNIARQTINRMVFRDNPRLSQTLQSLTVDTSIREVIRQMNVLGARVLAATITATPGTFAALIPGGPGNGVIVSSVRRPFDGLVLENSYAENLLVTCSADSFTGGATEGNETLSVTGTGGQTNVFAFNWPLGSNARVSVNAIDGNVDNGSGNLLTNSGFNDWTSNVPDNFSLVAGVAGTTIAQESTLVFDGSSACRITGDAGGTLTQIRQEFNDGDGTAAELAPLSQYSFCVWVRRDGTAAAAGVLTVDLVDDAFAVINDQNGTPNSFTIDLTALSTSYTAYTGVFRTPVELPSTYYIRIRLSTALTNGRSIYLDKAGLGLMTQVYTSGPFLSVHAGSIPFVLGDYATVAITNSRGAAGTLDTFQTLYARLFSEMINNELLLPSSSVPNISDTLITA